MEGLDETDSFLGRGIKFPVQVDGVTGRFKTTSSEEDIKEAIYLILMTHKGERIRNLQFGCDIHQYIFGTADVTSLKEMERCVEETLILWEPRIKDIRVTVSTEKLKQGRLTIGIDYVVRTTNNPFNLVFPFYLNEGFGEQK